MKNMKKRMFCLLCLLLAMVSLVGCSASEDPYVEKSYVSDAPVSEIRIDVRDRQILISPSADGQVHMDYFENNQEQYEIALSQDGVLTVTAVSHKEWTDYVGAKAPANQRKLTLQVPADLLDVLTVSTTNEDISLSSLTLKEALSLTANGGNINFEALAIGKDVELDVKNGNITGVLSGSYDDYAISCTIKKGETNLPSAKEGGAKTLTVQANNGDVNVTIE